MSKLNDTQVKYRKFVTNILILILSFITCGEDERKENKQMLEAPQAAQQGFECLVPPEVA